MIYPNMLESGGVGCGEAGGGLSFFSFRQSLAFKSPTRAGVQSLTLLISGTFLS